MGSFAKNTIPRGPRPDVGKPAWTAKRKAVVGCLSIQITLFFTELWEALCEDSFDCDVSHEILELMEKHKLIERVELEENEKDEYDMDYVYRLRMDMAAVRFKVKNERK